MRDDVGGEGIGMTADRRNSKHVPDEERRRERYERYAAARQARIDAEWEREKLAARHAWIAGGGTDVSFEREWPEMKADMMRRRDAGEKERRQREFRRILQGNF
jgi:hypothetical protein